MTNETAVDPTEQMAVDSGAGDLPARGPSLLMITTVARTLHFLIPYVAHFRGRGWTVSGAASRVTLDTELVEVFDHVYDTPLSRSVLDIGGLRRSIRALSRIVATEPDIVHVHTPIAAFVTRVVVRRLPADRRPLVAYTAHGFHFYRGGNPVTNALFVLAERTAGRWTDRLIVMNDEDELAARRHHIVPARKLVRMPGIGIDTGWYARTRMARAEIEGVRATLGIDDDVPLLVVVSELRPRKRVADIIEAVAMMRHREAVVAVAGGGPQRAHLEALAQQRGVGDRIHFLGDIKDIRPLVSAGVALVHASDREGLSRAIMESLSLETPVIASTARGNEELVGTDAGFTFPIGDVNALCARMDWVIDRPDEAVEMGRRGRRRMSERYEIAQLITMHEDLYRDMARDGELSRATGS